MEMCTTLEKAARLFVPPSFPPHFQSTKSCYAFRTIVDMASHHLVKLGLRKALFLILLLAIIPARSLTIQNPFSIHLLPKVYVTGTSSLVSWKPTVEGTVTLKLYAGTSTNMRYVSTIARKLGPEDFELSPPDGMGS